jgi:uncharacterized protein YecT (DUF1311 family)
MLDGAPLPIDVREGRYVMIGSHGGLNIRGRGFVWFDIKEGIGLGGVFFAPINGEPSPTLAVFSRQLNQNTLAMSQLPDAFAQDVAQWAAVSAVPRITTRYFIPDDGKKYVLVHDEDYCWSGPNTPAPDQEACEQKNAEAAEIDMNAAYFMEESHNAANATAWRLGQDQVAWIGIRNQSCGIGAAGLPCRIQITRRRTRLLLGQHS